MATVNGIFSRGLPLIVIIWVLSASSTPAHADGFRCPMTGRFIELGDTMAEVEDKCGAPKSKEDLFGSECNKRTGCHRFKEGEVWIYDFGRTVLTRILRFQKIYLAAIEEGRYGTKPD